MTRYLSITRLTALLRIRIPFSFPCHRVFLIKRKNRGRTPSKEHNENDDDERSIKRFCVLERCFFSFYRIFISILFLRSCFCIVLCNFTSIKSDIFPRTQRARDKVVQKRNESNESSEKRGKNIAPSQMKSV